MISRIETKVISMQPDMLILYKGGIIWKTAQIKNYWLVGHPEI